VLLKNENNVLPISKEIKNIHVTGKGSNNVGMQCGGWTISWQGGQNNILSGGTSILDAIKNTVDKKTIVTNSVEGSGGENADLIIVVVGEEPYAEGFGDRSDLSLSKEDLEVIEKVKTLNKPMVVVLLSGRPMIINSTIDQADAFVAAWLPGTEGQGVADVLFGDVNFTGKLSFSWPKSMEEIPVNIGDGDYNPLFQYKYGLSY
jgi:beta-glucosidase